MRRAHLIAPLPVLLVLLAAFAMVLAATALRAPPASAREPPAVFQLRGRPIGGTHAPAAPRPRVSLWGTTIATISATRALLIDGDTAEVIAVSLGGAPELRAPAGKAPALLAVDRDRGLAFVTDAAGDRVLVFETAHLALLRSFATRAEPYGIALTPDGAQVLVTAVADHSLAAYDARTGEERWSQPLPPEPRALAVSPDGRRALVGFVAQGVVARVELAARPTIAYLALDPAPPAGPETGDRRGGRGFARGAFAAAFVGNDIGVVAHQIAVPDRLDQRRADSRRVYGGALTSPVTPRLTLLGLGEERGARALDATLRTDQLRALAYDPGGDTLYLAAQGTGEVFGIEEVSQVSIALGWIGFAPEDCGPDGLAVADDGTLLAYCQLLRRVAAFPRVAAAGGGERPARAALGPVLSPPRFDPAAQRGRVLFHTVTAMISGPLGVACADCHPEGRSDGLSWRIEGHTLKTPFLAGRLLHTEPYKWDGRDSTLSASVKTTVRRLGGTGLTDGETRDLVAYLGALPAPRPRPARDPAAASRGRALFTDARTGCAGCHAGATMTDRAPHRLSRDLPQVDTPSLIAVGHQVSYFHDGSAATLRAALLDNGTVRGMGHTAGLTSAEIDDLVAYLETL
jgi:DNA-binding beta-propeller fold protein YncE